MADTMTISGVRVFRNGEFEKADVVVSDGRIVSVSKEAPVIHGGRFFNFNDAVLFPGFTDVHVHLREPGFSYKETMRTGTLSAAAGGYTTVCPMPNLSPVPDSPETLRPELEAIERDAAVRVLPYGSLTVGEKGQVLADLEGMASQVVAFSDDGVGVQDRGLMREAMLRAKALHKLVVAHCEINELLRGGYIHDGVYCRAHGHRGICSESEWRMVERDIELSYETGCAYHVCHVSTKESAELIRQGKKSGIDVSGETAPHYLLLCDEDLREDGRFKMNPPLRAKEDREAVLAAVLDGTLEVIATDHAPHTAEEKAKGLEGSLNGIVGLETAFPVLYTGLVKTGLMPLQMLLARLTEGPARRFGVPGGLVPGEPADLTVFDLENSYVIDPRRFLSMGKATPFEGRAVYGKCLLTIAGGEVAYRA